MGTNETRQRNQNWFLFKFRELRKKGFKYLDRERIVAQFMMEMTASQRMATEMLKMFQALGRIKLHKDRIEVLK